MAYDKSQVGDFAEALINAFDAVKDGLDAGDATAGVALLTSLAGVADEAADTDAFAAHLIAAIADRVGDRLVNDPV